MIKNFFKICVKTGHKLIVTLHLNDFIFRILLPYKHKIIEQTPEDAETILKKISPKPSGKAITLNKIIDNTMYDLQIIVPAFNAEKFIIQCMDSILTQVTQYTFKIVLIDDGSTDSTGRIADEYAKTNCNKVKVIHQNNQGFSGARNTGLSTILGKYIMFVDSDDKLLPGAIENLMNVAIKNDADIVEGGFHYLIGKILLPCCKHKTNTCISKGLYGYPWGKVYRNNLFMCIKFPESFWFEDTIMPFLVFPQAKKTYVINAVVYAYRKNNNAAISSTAPFNIKCIDTYWITELVLEERDYVSLPYDNECFSKLINQILLNYSRTRLMRQEIKWCIFTLSSQMVKKYFSNYLPCKNPLIELLLCNDFGGYCLYCETH